MEISKQCCTLEQAEKLKELGVKQDSAFMFEIWSYYGEKRSSLIDKNTYDNESKRNKSHWDRSKDCSAFTVAELGEMLPRNTYGTYKDDFGIWQCFPFDAQGNYSDYKAGLSEAEARAALLIHLLESKTITATEVNERK